MSRTFTALALEWQTKGRLSADDPRGSQWIAVGVEGEVVVDRARVVVGKFRLV